MMRPAETTRIARRVRAELSRRGWLLQADAQLPSVATLVAGAPIAGSWWSHPAGNQIYWVLDELEGDAEVLSVKLIKGKVTLLHRRLWPALLAVATAGAAWQRQGLSSAQRSLLERTRRAGCLRLDALSRWSAAVKPGDAARELERRLLVHADELHTEGGHHVKQLESWEHWRARVRLDASLPEPAAAERELEQEIGHGGAALLPWQRPARGRKRSKARARG